MKRFPARWPTGMTAATGALVLFAGCATVSPDEMETELDRVRAELRTEIREGDQAVDERLSTRISNVEESVETRLSALEGELDRLRGEFDVTVERLESAVRFNAPIHFAFDDATVRVEDQEVLERFASVVGEYYQGAVITVEGFTDPSGSPDYNRRLGMERAESVRDFLASRGLSADQLRAVSHGEDADRQVVPGAQGPGGDGWQNRRVAMVIDFRPDRPATSPITAQADPR
ncbi:MAG: OmpA family protein [Gemmatimonadota bacterium]